MSGVEGNPARQFAAAWQVASAALGTWREQVSAATTEALEKLDPAVRSAAQAGFSLITGDWRECRCQCATQHPEDPGVCDRRAMLTRRRGGTDVSLCAPCAVAQGVAEMRH